MATLTAREVYFDNNENLDVFQVVGGGQQVKVAQTITGFTYGSLTTADNLVGATAGTQAAGTPITRLTNRFITVAAGASGTLLPSVAGYIVTVINDGLNNLAVFPALGESINAQAVNTSFAVAQGTPIIFYCVSAGNWHTK
jgi:hypothetical protein